MQAVVGQPHTVGVSRTVTSVKQVAVLYTRTVYCFGAAGFARLLAMTPLTGIAVAAPDSDASGLKTAPSEY
ncbi:hypothetical protein GCM10027577_04010 [Spirosoma fluminis]